MNPNDDPPTISDEDVERLRQTVRRHPDEPLFEPGTVTECPRCQGPMVTTNDLEETIPTPRGLLVLTRLPGARCTRCDATQFDAAALGIIQRHAADEVVADYETTVTKTSGKTLGTYFKADLRRVLQLTGPERLVWTVLDRDHALVEVARGEPGASRTTDSAD